MESQPGREDAFARFLAAEPPECRRLWHALDEVAKECATDLAKLPRRVALASLPGTAHGRCRSLYEGLASLGSLERFYGPSVPDLEDVGNGAETTAVITLGPTDEKEH